MQRNLTEEIRSSEVVAKEYQDWVNSPMTQAVYNELLRRLEPILLTRDSIKGDISLYILGILTGWRRAIDAMVRLDDELFILDNNSDLSSEYKEEV